MYGLHHVPVQFFNLFIVCTNGFNSGGFCTGSGRPVAFTAQMGDKSTVITEQGQ